MKTTILILISSFSILYSQSEYADIIFNDSTVIANVSLQFIKGDTLIFAGDRFVSYTHIDSIAAIVERKQTRKTGGGAFIGGVAGVTAGLIFANIKKTDSDSDPYGNNSPEPNMSNIVQYGLIGLGTGAILGGVVASNFVNESERTYPLHGWSKADKLAFVRKLLVSANTQQRQVQNVAVITPMREKSREGQERETAFVEEPVSSLLITVGGAFPVGDFGKAESGSASGMARPALTAGAFLVLPGSPRLNYQIGLFYSSHSVDTKAFLLLAPDVSAGSWNLITPLAGLQYGLHGAGKTRLYLSCHLGFLFGSSPHITLRSGSQYAVQTESTGNAMAIKAGLGFVSKGKVDIGVSYLYANPEYEVTATGSGMMITAKAKQSTSLVLMTIGYYL